MIGENKERWRELCEQVLTSTNSNASQHSPHSKNCNHVALAFSRSGAPQRGHRAPSIISRCPVLLPVIFAAGLRFPLFRFASGAASTLRLGLRERL